MIETLTIEVEVTEDDRIIHPIRVNNVEIFDLGIYEIGEVKVWIVRKHLPKTELPKNVLPRHADDRENIKDLCIAVNQLIKYLEQCGNA
jgi:hypothetical protein